MKMLGTVLLVLALGSLAGCIVVPAYSPGYYGGGYSHSHGWRGHDRD